MVGGESEGAGEGIAVSLVLNFDVGTSFGGGDNDIGIGLSLDKRRVNFWGRGNLGGGTDTSVSPYKIFFVGWGGLSDEFFEAINFGLDLLFLGIIGNEREEAVVGVESGGKKSGLLLEAGKVVEILGFGRFENDGLSKVGKGHISITGFGVESGEFTSKFGRGGVEAGGGGKIGNGLRDKLGLRLEKRLINAAALIVTTIVLGKFFDGGIGGKNGLV